jgi:AcrR family transcriptional regulator
MLQHEPATRSPEETRARIIAATRELYAKKGRRGTTTREIADLAGVNEATLFRHFGNKDALIEACVLYYCPRAQLEGLIPNLSGDLVDDLRQIAQLLANRMDEVRDLIIMSLVETESGETAISDAAWRVPMTIRQVVGDYMTRRVESGDLIGDPLLLARFFMGMIFAQVIARKRFPETQYTLDEIIDFQINVFLNGVRKK